MVANLSERSPGRPVHPDDRLSGVPDEKFRLEEFPVHLGLGATVGRQPRFTGAMGWYEEYGRRTASDGINGRLVTMHTFDRPWDSWEVHPAGEELVVCIAGSLTLFQESESGTRSVTLGPGEAAVNPAGVWHTADVDGTATAIFVTAGMNTENRPR
jgi:mannose-6-phosphate isomerase-like protein (cupin superfamily)